MLALKKLCSTPSSLYPAYTASMIKPLGKATLLLAHARTYLIPKDLIIIFIALNFVLENYFEDVLVLVD